MNAISDHIERVWIIGCSRCANEGTSYADGILEAAVELMSMGWAQEGSRTFCPQCMGDTTA